ncbi:MAG: DUF452 family protein, partial [Victivallales bacterium]|nr:DUF452 family protein [Victivallales bacterium]
MKKFWLRKETAPELLLFFNGWGMDENPFKQLAVPDNHDVLMVYDYTTPERLDAELETYSKIRLAAWSLGVYAAAETLGGIKLGSATAINGTLKPIDKVEGIAPEIFQGTVDSWSEPAAAKFNQRMCGKYYEQFKAAAPVRSISGQKAELEAISRRIRNNPSPPNIFTQAVIGVSDRIFPRRAQEAHWRQARIPLRIIAEP